MGKLETNKKVKKNALLQNAFELFTDKGFAKTTISDIVSRAGLAKGTFYLYFKDKVQLTNHLIIKYSSLLIDEALEKAKEANIDDRVEELIFLIDYVVEFFKKNPARIKVIQKNLSWSLISDKLKDSDTYEVSNHLECYSDFLVSLGYTKDEAFQLIFMIIELVSTLCYSSIVLKQPDDIDHVKPLLYDTIRKMIQR